MIKLLSVVTLLSTMSLSAQIIILPNPADINSGIITITYGSMGDYSLFDPMGTSNLLLYTGLDTDSDPSTWDYHDDFADNATMIPFNFDSASGAYVAQIDVAGRTYLEEPFLNTVNLPAGLQVNDWYFLIATTDLSRQSADIKGSDYGWQAATLSEERIDVEEVFNVYNNKLIFKGNGDFTFKIYDLSGAILSAKTIDADITDLSYLPDNQLLLFQLEYKGAVKVLKYLR